MVMITVTTAVMSTVGVNDRVHARDHNYGRVQTSGINVEESHQEAYVKSKLYTCT